MNKQYPELYYKKSSGPLKKAGQAIIEYNDKVKTPVRDKELIVLPVDKKARILQLNDDFSQFLYLNNVEYTQNANNGDDQYDAWFGGTDEMPFLVELVKWEWFRVWQKGNFYEEIKPDVIASCERAFGMEGSKRQGDIFAYELPKELQSWEKVEAITMICGQSTNVSNCRHLFGTRHEMKGEVAQHYHPNLIGRGIIKAPDHADLELRILHIIAQTKDLKNPIKAD